MRFTFITILIFNFSLLNSLAQIAVSDFQLMDNYGKVEETNIYKKKKNINPFSLLYNGTLNIYQKHLSAQLDANCAFEITCSRFSRLMVSDFGLVKGYFLTFDRLGRCNHISTIESHPIRINSSGKIIEHTSHLIISK